MIDLYKPLKSELWFKKLLLSDKETMSFNHAYGLTICFSEDKWDAWYYKWIENCENKRFYRYIKTSGEFVGEAAYHYDDEVNGYLLDVIIHSKYRNKGYGTFAIEKLCEVALENGIKEVYDKIAIDNPSIKLFIKCGFEEVYRTNEYILLKKSL